MKTLLHTLTAITILLMSPLLYSCRPVDECPDEKPSTETYYKINSSHKSLIPYTGYDTLTFISNDGDTAVLYGTGKKEYMVQTAQKRSSNPACSSYDYYFDENIVFEFRGQNVLLRHIKLKYSEQISLDAEVNMQYAGFINLNRANDTIKYDKVIPINGNSIKVSGLFAGINDTNKLLYYNVNSGLIEINQKSGKQWLLK